MTSLDESDACQIRILATEVVVLTEKLDKLTKLVLPLLEEGKPITLLQNFLKLHEAKLVLQSNRKELPKLLKFIAENLVRDFGIDYVHIWHICVPEARSKNFESVTEIRVVASADFLIDILIRFEICSN